MTRAALIFAILAIFVLFQSEASQDVDVDVILEVDAAILDQEMELNWGDDPFLKTPGFVMDQGQKKPLKLTSILYDEQNPLAVINGKGVSLHSVLEGYEVVAIGPNYVVLQNDGSLVELTLPVVNDRPLATLKENQ